MTTSIKSKEYYSLMWEYLKRSDKYRIFCETFSNKDPLDIFVSNEISTFSKKHKIKPQVFINYFSAFGNIYNRNFDDWWNENVQYLRSGTLMVSDLSTDGKFHAALTNHILGIIYQYRNKTKFSSEDIFKIIKSIKYYFSHKDTDSIYLRLNVGRKINYNDVSKIIRKIVEERSNAPQPSLSVKSSRFMNKDLDYYLTVFDLKEQKLTYKQIIEKIGTRKEKLDSKNRGIWSSYARMVRHVKIIIKNIEKGSFPGKYHY